MDTARSHGVRYRLAWKNQLRYRITNMSAYCVRLAERLSGRSVSRQQVS